MVPGLLCPLRVMIAGPILVTGAAGFIGSHLVRSLVSTGAAATGLFSPRSPAQCPAGCAAAHADLRDTRAIEALFTTTPFRTVFHLAAHGVRQESDGGIAAVEVNTLATFSLARCALKNGAARFIYCGSGFEYLPQSTPVAETAPLGSCTLYGASKAAGWLLLDYLARMEGLPLLTVRPVSVFGPAESDTKLVPYVIRHALRRQPMQLTAGTQVRDYLYVSDVVDALLLAADKGEPRDVFNIGSGPEGARTVRSIVEAILEITGAPYSLACFGDAVRSRAEPPYLVCDPSRARTKLGWTQRVSFGEGMRRTVDWHREGSLLRANA
jgi:UDP-glucose 4-epimerase